METTTIWANARDPERLPPSHHGRTPSIVVLLPTLSYTKLVTEQTERSFHYHLITHPSYIFSKPIAFDADAFVEEVMVFCRNRDVDGVLAFDCFPTMLASVITQELRLPGPSFRSVFVCCNKRYMRRELCPEVAVTAPEETPPSFPTVLKVSDTQFYVGTRICLREADYASKWEDMAAELLSSEGVAARQRFYYKWATRFGWAAEYGWEAPSAVQLAHAEPLLPNKGEYQAEVVVLPDGTYQLADTGDIEHGPGQLITVFKTPGTFTLTRTLRTWLRVIVQALVRLGYACAAMDIEFVRLEGDEEAYELVEINSRYSYMGNYLHFGISSEASVSSNYHSANCWQEVRNLLNRTRLALGSPPSTLPSRDQSNVSKLAAMIYTERSGSLETFFDSVALHAMIDDGTLDGFSPKTCYSKGEVTAADLSEYNGWAKVGCILLTMEDDLEAINEALSTIVQRLFFGCARGFLPVEVIDEDGPDPTGLGPDVLNAPSRRPSLAPPPHRGPAASPAAAAVTYASHAGPAVEEPRSGDSATQGTAGTHAGGTKSADTEHGGHRRSERVLGFRAIATAAAAVLAAALLWGWLRRGGGPR